MTSNIVNTVEAKELFTELVNRVAHYKEHIILARRGKEIAAVIPIEDFKLLLQWQDKNDLQEAIDALKEARHNGTISLEQLKDETSTLS